MNSASEPDSWYGLRMTYFDFLEIRYKVALHELTGRVVECPIDEMNRPAMSVDTLVRIPPTEIGMEQFFAGWREELVTCRKFASAARNYMGVVSATPGGLAPSQW
ncbi:hypothetical protein ACQP1G_17415 [Nocardia sp. CA-107356]|uniref:hypothetical protein n=1 Tax=Nocardia sp. CA-107356 TaxID=3239972 RepID=UPI003D91BDAD